MSDKTFELSIMILTAVVILWIIAGIFLHLSLALVILAALVVEIGAGIALLRLWGKSYMARQ